MKNGIQKSEKGRKSERDQTSSGTLPLGNDPLVVNRVLFGKILQMNQENRQFSFFWGFYFSSHGNKRTDQKEKISHPEKA